ncbi:hypothetical protein NSK_006279, partial [Nannochloropsis salina CCMP1776]
MAVRVSVIGKRSRDMALPDNGRAYVPDATVAVPGQVLMEADVDKEGGLSFIRGHGTYQEDAAERGSSVGVESKAGKVRLCAGVAGVIERVNKLVTVVPPNTRYQGAIGDLVVGRVTEVGAKRWKVDL